MRSHNVCKSIHAFHAANGSVNMPVLRLLGQKLGQSLSTFPHAHASPPPPIPLPKWNTVDRKIKVPSAESQELSKVLSSKLLA